MKNTDSLRKEYRSRIVDIFKSNPFMEFDAKNILQKTDTKNRALISLINDILRELRQEGTLDKGTRNKYRLSESLIEKYRGILSLTNSGTGFVKLENQSEEQLDVLINQYDIASSHAMDGDTVEVIITSTSQNGRSYGTIRNILKRSNKPLIGIIHVSRGYGFVTTKFHKAYGDIFIPEQSLKGARDSQKVSVRIVSWPKNSKNPEGKVAEVLGDIGENETEMHAILAEFDLPYSYPRRLEKIADSIQDGITAGEIAKRRDMRGICTFTIDPASAKDFDDALSFRQLKNGNYEVGVHIADVTFYVHPGDDIDGEGMQRATSVYLVDRTIPMLPEKLSNNLCSLRPDEDKLCYSAIFEMNEKAETISQWFGRTVIRSQRRFTYDEAQEVIEGTRDEMTEAIQTLDKLAKQMRDERFKKGAVNFERDEPQFELDEKGKPIRVYFKEMKDSNQLIEEFMLLANRRVAELVGGTKKTFVYRIHDLPEKDKFDRFCEFITKFGYRINSQSGKKAGEELTALLHKVKGKSEENIISTLAVRTMAKAVYSTHNIGHYGLAFKYYTHFTSPIRRYPDMMVHRLLDRYLNGGGSVPANEWEEMCDHCSAQEVKATEAERASIKYKMVEFMEDKVGKEYDGVVTSVTEWGIYVELEENRIEGMVSLKDIDDDHYFYDRDNYKIIGSYTDKSFTIGDKVRIAVMSADLERKQLNYRMVGYYDRKGNCIQIKDI